MAVYGYTKNYKLIKPQFDTDTWHDYEYDNLDTIDAVLSAIFASGDWQGFWKTNTHYDAGGVVIDRVTDTMYKIMVEHTTSEATFAEEFAAHPTYYELWSPNNLAEDWAIKMDGVISNVDYSSKAYAISSALIDTGSAKEWAIKTDNSVGTTGEYSAKKYATDAASSASTATSQASAASASATLSSQWAVSPTLVASTDYSSKSWATGSLDAGSAKDWAIKEGGSVGTTGKYSAKVYSLAAENHYEKARDWASKTNGQVESTDYSAKAYAISEGLISAGSAKEWSNKAKAWATSSTIIEDGKYGASYYALQAYNANVSAQNNKTLSQDWAVKMDGQVASTDYSSKYYAGQAATDASNSHVWAEGTDEQVQALGGTHSSKVWAEQSTNANVSLTNSPYTTNRILEIPQNIKLESESSSVQIPQLILKAGSKVYVSTNGTFNAVTIQSDVVGGSRLWTQDHSRELFAVYVPSTDSIVTLPVLHCFSQNTAPTSFLVGYAGWFDTSTNTVKYTADSGNTWTICSLPICLGRPGAEYVGWNGYLDQVFNGFGYIGSTVFALPGIKVQIPNGKNEDGSYISNIVTITSVNVNTTNQNGLFQFVCTDTGSIAIGSKYVYDDTKNLLKRLSDGVYFSRFILADVLYEGGKVTQFTPRNVDSVANSNASNFSQAGRSYLSTLPAPTSSYTEYTVGASGANYVATDTGWAFAYGSATGNQTTSEYLQIIKDSFSEIECASKPINMTVCMYVKKGDTFTVHYKLNNGADTAGYVRLYKAEGVI